MQNKSHKINVKVEYDWYKPVIRDGEQMEMPFADPINVFQSQGRVGRQSGKTSIVTQIIQSTAGGSFKLNMELPEWLHTKMPKT